MEYDDGLRSYRTKKPFEGVLPNMQRRWRETESAWVREELERYQNVYPCPVCDGARLKPEALAVKIAGLHIAQVSKLSITEARDWFLGLNDTLNDKQLEIAHRILKEINDRLGFLVDVGLNYLTLDRASGTLSGGESQRIRLASQIGSGLVGVLYVLDEPSIGLHPRDNNRLLETLKRLRDLGNTVIVVEHDEEAMREADYLVDLGPGAGVHGGHLVAHGTPEAVMQAPASLTGQYLTGFKQIHMPAQRRPGHPGQVVEVLGARANNLKSIDVSIPLGTFVCVTGVPDRDRPLILAGVDFLFPIYQEANTYPNLLSEFIPGNPDRLPASELHEKAWSLLAPRFETLQQEALAKYEQLAGTGKTADRIDEILPAAYHGRIESLMVAVDRIIWGEFDPENSRVTVHEEQQPDDYYLLDLATVHTLLSSGDIYLMESKDMPRETSVLAVFRY